jgi:preprotein translocase subunit Sss1
MPERIIGPNHVSLNEAIVNYKAFGACEKRVLEYVRKPLSEEYHEDD